MDRVVDIVHDDKAVVQERERLLDPEGDQPFAKEDCFATRTEKSSWAHLRETLPSIKDVIKLILFCTVTAAGMTFISEAMPRIGWIAKPFSKQSGQGSMPAHVDSCQSNAYNKSLSMDFADPTKFSFFQKSQSLRRPGQVSNLLHTTGTIEVRSTEKSSRSDVHVDLNIHGTDPQLGSSNAIAIEKTDSSLGIRTPYRLRSELASDNANSAPCLHVSVIVTLHAGAKLERLGIDSDTFPVTFHPGLDYAESRIVETRSEFKSTSTYSRETIINVNSASVTGSYPLYDLLSIHTESGSIYTDIQPKNASRENVKPAVLRLTSNSGSIHSSSSLVSVPDRDYHTQMSTSSGSIEAGILHGLRTSLRSINGRINADIYPYGHNDSRTDIEVHDTSGSIDITLHASSTHPSDPLKKLYGYYRGVSSSLNLFYPAQWQGTIAGTTLSGSVDLDWQGLQVVKDGKEGYVKRAIEAVRGNGEGKLEFHETSGSVRLSGESGGL